MTDSHKPTADRAKPFRDAAMSFRVESNRVGNRAAAVLDEAAAVISSMEVKLPEDVAGLVERLEEVVPDGEHGSDLAEADEKTLADAKAALTAQSTSLAQVTRERDEAQKRSAENYRLWKEACAIANERGGLAVAAEAQVSALTAERERLREALENVMGYVDTPISRRRLAISPNQEPWLLLARAALTPAPDAGESGEAGE
mgnify:CR=1 FL=1|tara:strand:+ start:46308 stop:46910 length:603 start_codon:yes stop_codon:yes gene_type:complete